MCNQTQVQLRTAAKANTREAGADVKESGLFRWKTIWKTGDSCHKVHFLGRWGLKSQSPYLRKMEDYCLKAHLLISVVAEVFIRRGRETEQRDEKGGLQSSLVQMSTLHSGKASVGLVCIILV